MDQSDSILWSDVIFKSGFSEGGCPENIFYPSEVENKTQPVIIILFVNNIQLKHNEPLPFSEHNYLRFFRQIYDQKGWTTLQCVSKCDVTDRCEKTVQSIMAAIEGRGLQENPMFLHLLGHESIALYNQFTKAIEMENGDIFRVKGTIIDSGPAREQGLVASMRKKFPTIFNIILFIWHILAFTFPELFSQPRDCLDSYEQFCYNKCPCPQLYMYSTSDHLVNSTDVETAINIRHRAGVSIDRKCWSDTEHARHLFTHEEEYTALCHGFIEKNLRA